jgi:hypothetical protein
MTWFATWFEINYFDESTRVTGYGRMHQDWNIGGVRDRITQQSSVVSTRYVSSLAAYTGKAQIEIALKPPSFGPSAPSVSKNNLCFPLKHPAKFHHLDHVVNHSLSRRCSVSLPYH